VELHGEHDLSTCALLSTALADATRLDDDADVVVDLSDVAFMDASTIGVLVAALVDVASLVRSVGRPLAGARRHVEPEVSTPKRRVPP
jgi:anti-anti-sigma factor